MDNKNVYIGRIKGGEREGFYPRTCYSAIIDVPPVNEGEGKVFSVLDDVLSWIPLKTIDGVSVLGEGDIHVNEGWQPLIDENNPLNADYIADGTTNAYYTLEERTKLSNIESGAEVNVQSNWNENDSSSDAYILNKPTITDTLPTVICREWNKTVAHGECTSYSIGHSGYVIIHLWKDCKAEDKLLLDINGNNEGIIWINDGCSSSSNCTLPSGIYIVYYKYDGSESLYYFRTDGKIPMLSGRGFGGDYNDLRNTPVIPAAQVNSDWNANSGVAQILNKPSLATVATSGNYNDLTNTPTIPAAQIQSDWNQSDNTQLDYIKNKPTIPSVTGKADKVSGATNGNLAGLDSNGNLTDSGVAKGILDKMPSTLGTTGQIPKVNSGATAIEWGDIPAIPNGTYIDIANSGWGPNQVISAFLRTAYFYNGEVPSRVGDYVYSKSTRCLHKITSITQSGGENVANADFIAFFSGFDGNYNNLSNKPAAIPTPTSADENKLLSVDSNGAYVLVTIVNSENIAY